MAHDCVRWHDLVFTSPNIWYTFQETQLACEDERNFLHTRSFKPTEPQCCTKVTPQQGKQQSVKTPTQVKALL